LRIVDPIVARASSARWRETLKDPNRRRSASVLSEKIAVGITFLKFIIFIMVLLMVQY